MRLIASECGAFNEFVEECSIGRVLPNFESQENDMLMKRVALFRELGGVSSHSTLR